MTTTLRHRSAVLAGLFLLSLIVLAMSIQTSSAMRSTGAGTGGGVSVTPPTPAQAQIALVKHGQLDRAQAATAPAGTVQLASTGGTSATTWIVIAILLAALLIGVWAFLRRRSGPEVATSEGAFCSLHPEDAKCGAV
jgi:LPXTG-motif cell wall-anchored protein